jgi:hypothetical protein
MQRAIANSTANSRPAMTMPVTLSGTDFLGTLTVLTAPLDAAARIIFSADISPSFFPGTRLTSFSNLYERYLFNKFAVRYVPAVPTTLACQLLAYIDTDPTDDPSTIIDPDALYRQAVAQSGSKQWNFIAGNTIPLVIKKDKTLYYTGATRVAERLNLQGRVYILQLTNPIAFDGKPIIGDSLGAGSLFMDWNCTFSTPQINPEASQFAGVSTQYDIPAPAQLTSMIKPLNRNADAAKVPDAFITFTDLVPNATYVACITLTTAGFATAAINTVVFSPLPVNFVNGQTPLTAGSQESTVRVSTTFTIVYGDIALFLKANSKGSVSIAIDNAAAYAELYNWKQSLTNNDVVFEVSRLYI